MPPAESTHGGAISKVPFFVIKTALFRKTLHPMLIMSTLIGLVFFYFGGDYPDFACLSSTLVWLAVLLLKLRIA